MDDNDETRSIAGLLHEISDGLETLSRGLAQLAAQASDPELHGHAMELVRDLTKHALRLRHAAGRLELT